jgi:hypothetical protein
MEAFSQDFPCGQVGVLGVTIDDGDGNNVLPRTTANIVQIECVDTYAVYRYLGVYPSDPSLSPYVITWDDGVSLATEEILVSTDAPAPVTDMGPCGNWIDAADVVECCEVTLDSDNEAALQSFAESASQVAFLLSGEIFTGLCGPVTVRPCRDECGCWPSQYIEYTGGGGRWIDLGWYWSGSWWGNWNSSDRCGCGCVSKVRLSGYPVQGISQVKIDGAIVAPSEYRLDENRFLVRKNDAMWPVCQDLSRDDDQPGTFSVSYWYGAVPPQLGLDAAAALACEFYNACNGGECNLPTQAVRIVRQGITVERLQPLASMLRLGETGIPVWDAFVAMYGGHRRRPSVWSSDGPRYARPVGS